MRIILIIQSLIILGGAYYVYTLTRTPALPTEGESSASNINIEVRREGGTATVRSNDEGEESTDVEGIDYVEGANDLGMEFPMPDYDEVPESR